jgi:hypothetical protein
MMEDLMKAAYTEVSTETGYCWSELMEPKEKTIARTIRLPLSVDETINAAMDAMGAERTEIIVKCCSQENIKLAIHQIAKERESARNAPAWRQLTRGQEPPLEIVKEASPESVVTLKPKSKRG